MATRERSRASAGGHDTYECARAWVALRSAYARVTECLDARLGRDCGLSINDFEVLVHLESVEPRRLRLGDLREAVALSQPALSRLISRLEQRGLVCRADAPDDRRAVLLQLIAGGQEILQRAVPIHAACVQEILTSRLTEAEQEALIASLTRI